MTAGGISVVRQDRIALVTIDRPPVNALTFAAYDEIAAAFAEVSGDPGLSAVVLTGAGTRTFCAGHDVKEFVTLTPESAALLLPKVRHAFDAVEDCAIPVVAAINGPALGAGLALASLSDIRVAASTATFALPEIDVGVLGSASHLMRLVPQGLTRLMAFTGRRLTAAQAYRVGMVEEVVEPADVLDTAMSIASAIAEKSPEALRLMKSAMGSLERLSARDGYALECELTALLRHGSNAAEGAMAFVGNREPAYDRAP